MLERWSRKSPRDERPVTKTDKQQQKASRKQAARKVEEERQKAKICWGVASYTGPRPYCISWTTRNSDMGAIDLLMQALDRTEACARKKGENSAVKALIAYVELLGKRVPKKTDAGGYAAVKRCLKDHVQRLNGMSRDVAAGETVVVELQMMLDVIRKQAAVERQRANALADRLSGLGLTPRIQPQDD